MSTMRSNRASGESRINNPYRVTVACLCLSLGLLAFLLPSCGSGKPAADQFPMLRVGHVGHDHQLALYVAALEGERFRQRYGIYLQEVKEGEVYDLVEGSQTLARLRLIKIPGGSDLPAALSRGEIDIGLGGIVPAAKMADGGEPLKVMAPLQTDGDQLVMRKDSPVSDWPAFVVAAKGGGKPLRIGYKAPLAVAKQVFEGALSAEGIPCHHDPAGARDGVLMIDFGSEASPLPLLSTGALDGFVMNQPGPAQAVHQSLGKVVCQLHDLPPQGKWLNHPCCCVIARQQTIEQHAVPLKGFLKLIHLGTQLIRDDQTLAVECAHRWTRNPREVEAASVPTVSYGTEATESWLRGLKTWHGEIKKTGLFKGRYAQISSDEFVQDFCSLRLCQEAAKELRDKGFLK